MIGMHPQEQIEMMRRAASDIKSARAEIERLRPRAEAYDNMAALLGMMPKASRVYGEDVAWLLEKKAGEIEAEIKAEAYEKQKPTVKE